MGRRKYTDQDLADIAERVESHALAYWSAADAEMIEAGRGWYALAHEEAKLLADAYALSVSDAAGVIAVLSPLCRWAGNIADAWTVAEGGTPAHALPRNAAKARRILAGESTAEVIGGRKVTAFWRNIAEPIAYRGTVNDSWIARAFGLDEADVFNTVGVYEAVTLGLQRAAAKVGERPSSLQAIVWLVAREAWQRNNDEWTERLPVAF